MPGWTACGNMKSTSESRCVRMWLKFDQAQEVTMCGSTRSHSEKIFLDLG